MQNVVATGLTKADLRGAKAWGAKAPRAVEVALGSNDDGTTFLSVVERDPRSWTISPDEALGGFEVWSLNNDILLGRTATMPDALAMLTDAAQSP